MHLNKYMESKHRHISYVATGYFSKIVADYIGKSETLAPFYAHSVDTAGIQQAITERKAFETDRALLVDVLEHQYAGLELSSKQEEHLQALLSTNTFTITTAHQPNIFTGPLYFIYKILHAIKLADTLGQLIPEYHFVPIYYMGSEDADLDELGYLYLNGEKLQWNTQQQGAVGRMKVDKDLVALIERIHGQTGIHAFGSALKAMLEQCFTIGKTIQQATLELVHLLFAEFGLLVLIPDNARLKKAFEPVVIKELTTQFSHTEVAHTIEQLAQHYKVQAAGRDINLFYLTENARERIAFDGTHYTVTALNKQWTKEACLQEVAEHPERISANVILRGVFQETILPNIAFIGGGGELAYWLELKNVFKAVQVSYPVLILRNSFLLAQEAHEQQAVKLGFTLEDMFQKQEVLYTALVKRLTNQQLSLQDLIQQHQQLYQQIQQQAASIDITLQQHTEALYAKASKPLYELEKKMLRAEKRKYAAQQRQLAKLHQQLFPLHNLQERIENFASFFAQYGPSWLRYLYDISPSLEQEFTIVVYK